MTRLSPSPAPRQTKDANPEGRTRRSWHRDRAARGRTTKGRTPAHFLVAACLGALACVSVMACDSAESEECSKDADCQEITCGDGSKMQICEEGACLQGDDCEQEADGGW